MLQRGLFRGVYARLALLCGLVLVMNICPAREGKTYYVSTAGDNDNSGLSIEKPWRDMKNERFTKDYNDHK